MCCIIFSDDYILLNPKCVLPEFIMHVQLEWAPRPDVADTDQSDFTQSLKSCHPALLHMGNWSSDSLTSDVAVRDTNIFSNGKLFKTLGVNQFGADSISYLMSNEEDNRFGSARGEKLELSSEYGLGTYIKLCTYS